MRENRDGVARNKDDLFSGTGNLYTIKVVIGSVFNRPSNSLFGKVSSSSSLLWVSSLPTEFTSISATLRHSDVTEVIVMNTGPASISRHTAGLA